MQKDWLTDLKRSSHEQCILCFSWRLLYWNGKFCGVGSVFTNRVMLMPGIVTSKHTIPRSLVQTLVYCDQTSLDSVLLVP